MSIPDKEPTAKDQASNAGARWYAVKTRPQQEQTALFNLENQGFESYLPHVCISRHRRGKWQRQREVLFPGYLFIRVDTAIQNIASVRSTIGVSGLVRFGNLILSVDDEVIHHVKAQEQSHSLEPEVQLPQFQPGDKLSILNGPLAGINAAFQMTKSIDRVLVLVNILGSEKSIAVDINSLAPCQ